jgi:hypothetical protein
MKTAIVAALAFCLSHIGANAQGYQESINLGTSKLTLGMPQETVMAALAPEYNLEKLHEAGTKKVLGWGIKPKKRPSSNFTAMVDFR